MYIRKGRGVRQSPTEKRSGSAYSVARTLTPLVIVLYDSVEHKESPVFASSECDSALCHESRETLLNDV